MVFQYDYQWWGSDDINFGGDANDVDVTLSQKTIISVTKRKTLSLFNFSEKSESKCEFYFSKKKNLCSTGDKNDVIDFDFCYLWQKMGFLGIVFEFYCQ